LSDPYFWLTFDLCRAWGAVLENNVRNLKVICKQSLHDVFNNLIFEPLFVFTQADRLSIGVRSYIYIYIYIYI